MKAFNAHRQQSRAGLVFWRSSDSSSKSTDNLWADGGMRGPSVGRSHDLGYIYIICVYLKRRRVARQRQGHVLCFCSRRRMRDDGSLASWPAPVRLLGRITAA